MLPGRQLYFSVSLAMGVRRFVLEVAFIERTEERSFPFLGLSNANDRKTLDPSATKEGGVERSRSCRTDGRGWSPRCLGQANGC
jgi:hypothetical protein